MVAVGRKKIFFQKTLTLLTQQPSKPDVQGVCPREGKSEKLRGGLEGVGSCGVRIPASSATFLYERFKDLDQGTL